MAELFTFVHVGDVNLNARTFQTPDAVLQGNTCMGIGTCIEYDTVAVEAHFLYLVDYLTLQIALVVVYANFRKAAAQLLQIVFPGTLTVDFRFSNAQQVQVWTIDNLNSHNFSINLSRQS